MLMTCNLFSDCDGNCRKEFSKEKLFLPKGEVWALFAEFLGSLFGMNLRKIRCGRRDQWKNFLLFIWHKTLEEFFSKLHFFTALLQKCWGFPEWEIGSEFHGIYLQELGHIVSILKRHISLCVLFCANKKWLFFCLLTDPCHVKHPDIGQSRSSELIIY